MTEEQKEDKAFQALFDELYDQVQDDHILWLDPLNSDPKSFLKTIARTKDIRNPEDTFKFFVQQATLNSIIR